MDESALARIEAERVELESNIAKLRKSLRHWQTLEIDYEGLKEEFQGLRNDSSYDECLQAAKEFGAELVDENELKSLLKGSQSRYPHQVVGILSKRLDYVSRNVESIRKQLSDSEKKRNALLLAEEPEYRTDAGLPLTEITEELDESGRVISSKLNVPGAESKQLIEVLKKAGIDDLAEKDGTIKKADEFSGKVISTAENAEDEQAQTKPLGINQAKFPPFVTDKSIVKAGQAELKPTFADDVRHNPNDSIEEAALRQDMLDYGLDEVGAIVAELDFDENGSDVSYEENDDNLNLESDFDDFDDDIDDDDEEEEDEQGKSKSLNLSTRYRRKMEELEKKLGIKDMQNLGPMPDLPPEIQAQLNKTTPAEAAGKAAIARQEAIKSALKHDRDEKFEASRPRSRKEKKQVAFAESLDIAKEPKRPSDPPVISDTLVERTKPDVLNIPAPAESSSRKPSRFKNARSVKPQTPMFPPPMGFFSSQKKETPEGPEGKIIAETLIERPLSETDSLAPPPDANDIDEEIHRREIATEYFKMRNKLIHQQGGFVGDGESDNYGEAIAPAVIEDENSGKTRKVSRFKAARAKG